MNIHIFLFKWTSEGNLFTLFLHSPLMNIHIFWFRSTSEGQHIHSVSSQSTHEYSYFLCRSTSEGQYIHSVSSQSTDEYSYFLCRSTSEGQYIHSVSSTVHWWIFIFFYLDQHQKGNIFTLFLHSPLMNIHIFYLDQHQKGNIFTLFLHSPLMAFCYISNIADIQVSAWNKCQVQVDKFISEASKLLSRSRTLGEKLYGIFEYKPSRSS